jgi:hypothetical protein
VSHSEGGHCFAVDPESPNYDQVCGLEAFVEEILELQLARVLVLVGGGPLPFVESAKLDLDLPFWYNV